MPTWIFAIRPSLTNFNVGARDRCAVVVYTIAHGAMALLCFEVSIWLTAWSESAW